MVESETRKPIMRDVAKLARVALMRVSRSINHHPSVRPTTRRKVETAIAQLGYQQNEAARLLRGQRAKVIGLISRTSSSLPVPIPSNKSRAPMGT